MYFTHMLLDQLLKNDSWAGQLHVKYVHKYIKVVRYTI